MEQERFKRTMKAQGHWRDGELKAAEPVSYIREDDRGSVTLIEPVKGYWVDGAPVWPAYNPVTGEDLSDQLQAVLEANHKKGIILSLADADATLKDMWEEHGNKTLNAASTANTYGNHGVAIYKAYDLAKQFGDFGVKAEVFTSKGKEYIAITTKNNSDKVMRHAIVNSVRVKINGHKYRLNNHKVMQLGLTPQNRMSGYKGGAVVTFIISATINTNDLVFNNDFHLVDWFGNVGADMFQALLTIGAGEAILLGIGALFGGTSVIFGAVVIVAVSIVISQIFEEWNISEKIVSELKDAIN
ncbi:MAG: hypothetical protein ACRCWP_03180 [Shewanella sp.]